MENKLTDKKFLSIVIPFTISSLTQPLLGAVDSAVVGRLPSPIYIGGVSIGVTIFNTIFWIFGFLSVSTTGQSAQSFGDDTKKIKSFMHPFVLAIIIGIILILSKNLIWYFSMKILNPTNNVSNQAKIYYQILIYSSPIALVNYVILGWFMGQSKIRTSVFIQVGGNLLNVFLDIVFVNIFNLKVDGVAFATLASQVTILIFGFYKVIKLKGFNTKFLFCRDFWNKEELLKQFKNDSDLMIRSICLIIITNTFMTITTTFGTLTLAANTILIQIETTIGYFFGGISSACSVLCGKAQTQCDYDMSSQVIKKTTLYSVYISIFLSFVYILFGKTILSLFTNIDEVLKILNEYYLWIVPIISFSSFGISYSGVFVGMLQAKPIRNSMIKSCFVFLICNLLIVSKLQNHGLWISYNIYYLLRSISMYIDIKKLSKA